MMNETIPMYGTTWCQDCKRAKHIFVHRVPEQCIRYTSIDIDTYPNGFCPAL